MKKARGQDGRRFKITYNSDDVYQHTAHLLLLYKDILMQLFSFIVIFMLPRSRSGGILFLSCLSFCHSVLLSETLTLLITFEQ